MNEKDRFYRYKAVHHCEFSSLFDAEFLNYFYWLRCYGKAESRHGRYVELASSFNKVSGLINNWQFHIT